MMTLQKQIPAVWVYTTADIFNVSNQGEGPAFLTRDEQSRLERLRQARLLFRGEHEKYFIEEGRTQFDFPIIQIGSRRKQLYIPLNVLRLISLKGADLLFGQEPLVRVDDDQQQAAISDLAERTHLHKRLYNAAVDCSYEGETFIESCRRGGVQQPAYLRVLDAGEMFPQGEIGVDDQYQRYIRRQIEPLPGTDKVHLLLETTYLPGSIERRVWQLGDKFEKTAELTLDNWPTKPIDGDDFQPVSKTGIAQNTITWIPNALDHGKPVSDYDGLIECQDALNEANTRMKRVLYKHGNPKIFFPTGAANDQGNISAQDDAFYGNPDEKPDYIVWEAQLDAASKDRSFTLNTLCILAEVSPALLGLKEGAAPDAVRKLRLEAENALAKASRKATNWKPGIRRAMAVARELEQSSPGALAYGDTTELPAVEMRDGIGVDEQDQADTLQTLRAAGLMSVRRGLEVLLGDSAAVGKEEAELKREAEAATPSILMAHPGLNGEEPGQTTSNTADITGAATEAA